MILFGSQQHFITFLVFNLGFHHRTVVVNTDSPALLTYSSDEAGGLHQIRGLYPMRGTETLPNGLNNYSLGSHNSRKLFLLFGKKEKKKQKKKVKRPVLDKAEVQASFDRYYKCIEKKNMDFKNGRIAIHTMLYQETQSVTLKCRLCLRLDQDIERYNVHWTRKTALRNINEQVVIDHDKFILSPDKDLMIRGLSVDDTGQYACMKYDQFEAVYQIDVVKFESRIQVVESGLKGRNATLPQTLEKHNLVLFTSWTEWGACNKCNKRGERQRVGVCSVKKSNTKAPVKAYDMPSMDLYPAGVPCRSTVLRAYIANLPAVKSRKSETMLGYCWQPCPTLPALKEILDDEGNVIEVVKVGEGMISMKEDRPTMPPLVKRKTIYQQQGTPLIMSCPAKHAADLGVRWQNGSQVLNVNTVKRYTRGRVRINTLNKLVIRKLKIWDTQVYSCWIEGRHVATIKVRVLPKSGRNMNDYIVAAGVGMTVLGLLAIGCKVASMQRSRGRHIK